MFVFLDESLRVKEDKYYLERIVTDPESHSLEQYYGRRNAFGTIALLAALRNKSAEDIYQRYKSRMTIEELFDGMKNVLGADHTYIQD